MGVIGQKAWNRGLTKETDTRVARGALKKKQWYKNPDNAEKVKEFAKKVGLKHKGLLAWNKGLTKESDPRVAKGGENVSKTRQEMSKRGKLKAWNKGLTSDPTKPNYDKRLPKMMGDDNVAKRPEVRKKISKYAKENPPMKRPEVAKKHGETIRRMHVDGLIKSQKGWKRSEQACKNMSIGQQKRMKDNPEEWKATCKKAGLTVHQKHPNQAREMGLSTQRKHPNQSSEVAKRTQREWKERDPEDYYKKKRSYAKKMFDAREKVKKEDPKAYKEMYKNAGKNTIKSLLANSPYVWNGVPFLSNLERECAKLLLKEPIDGVNCNIKIGRKSIDFFPQSDDLMFQGKFVEFHPYCRRTTHEEYYQKRKDAIENSEYKGIELVVIKNLEEIKNDKR